MGMRSLFGVAVFLGAFLLFQIQPMVAKAITPLFGGSAMVWTTCMVFFQAALLVGYLYAHLTSRWPVRFQAAIHVSLLVIVQLCLTLTPGDVGVSGGADPTLSLIGMLSATVGPYFVLTAATAPLIQRWYAVRFQGSPYRLYALSNVGSLLGLLCYPFLIEPRVSLPAQIGFWKGALLVLMGCLGCLGLGPGSRTEPVVSRPIGAQVRITAGDWMLWLLLSAAPSALLLAVTNVISVEIAPFPLLWVVPLSLYLLTFIISFDHERWNRPLPIFFATIMSLAATGVLLHQRSPHLLALAGGLYLSMFLTSLLCHGELSRLRPHPSCLTAYFLTISLGGVLGGLSVGVVAPHLLTGYDELPLAFALCIGLASFRLFSERNDPSRRLIPAVIALTGAFSTAFWVSPSLQQSLLNFLEIRRGSDLNQLSLISATAVILGTAFSLRRFLVASDAVGQTSHARGTTRNGVVIGLSFVLSAAAFGVCLWASMTGGGWTLAGLSPGIDGFVNPVAVWGAGALGILVLALRASGRTSEDADAAASSVQRVGAHLLEPLAFLLASSILSALLLKSASNDDAGAAAIPLLATAVLVVTFVFRPRRKAAPTAFACGLLAASIAPVVFDSIGSISWGRASASSMVSLAIALCSLGLALSLRRPPLRWTRHSILCAGIAVAVGVLAALQAPHRIAELQAPLGGLLAAAVQMVEWTRVSARRRDFATALVVCASGTALGLTLISQPDGRTLAAERNFYSLLRVEDVPGTAPVRVLLHGNVQHGFQFLDPSRRLEPTSYYHRESGIGRLLRIPRRGPRDVGLIGLGVGTLAAYGEVGDHFRFYEIDPKVVDLADRYFSFLKESRATVECVGGDGRRELELAPSLHDILVVDAFTGDAIPSHLMTKEAVDLYLQRLKPNGVLAIHLSNTHIDLSPVVNGHVLRLGLQVVYVDSHTPAFGRSLWALISRTELPLGEIVPSSAVSDQVLHWSDHHHSLLPLIRLR
jgi:hypothetical protein